MKTKSHRASTLPMWVVWVIIVVLVWLGFAALIILYATLPNDRHVTLCDQRKGGVDKTNDSQYVLGIVYRVFVTAVAAIIAVLFIISGTWIVSMVRKLSKDKSLSAAKVGEASISNPLYTSTQFLLNYTSTTITGASCGNRVLL